MSAHAITLDEFAQLDRAALATALRLFEQELAGTLHFLREHPEARTDEPTLDSLTQLLTLRKVFRTRLEELAAAPAAATAVAALAPAAAAPAATPLLPAPLPTAAAPAAPALATAA